MTIYAYTRVSTQEQIDGASLAEQQRKIEGWRQLAGLDRELMHVFFDQGVSGSQPLNERPEGQIILGLMQPGDTLIAAKLDRLFRSARDALNVAEKCRDMGVKLVLLDISTEPVTENGVGKIIFTILAAMAEFERERIHERCTEGRRAKRKAGGHIGGLTPFGYQKIGAGREARLEPDPAQQEAIRSIYEASDAGLPLRDVSAYIFERHGLKVSHETIRKILAKRPDQE